ncbi:hydantoinase/oxoprolinase family protein [Roseomonas xinghualingensis]|uniref:hydantoinase/oxoprolinase family protein n=1 Tax=Roseomonas xinghualingensis TaxID=2986475 RepID=UPI0021F0DA9D|nr:hydantoinase/oxoprolinase family protein [Roseomonas sp. SXEYE001]MCV4209741.1 hydantoinase/oxoprolinase family protein [Roseomonas sp. SXEYE001]
MSALAIDIGGTFTDIVLYDDTTGRFAAHKELTTPADPARGVVAGIRHLFAQEGTEAAGVTRVVHATTLFTNALIERRGAPTGLITTAGFRDTLEIGHERKYELYDLHLPLPQPLVRRSRRLEAIERLAPDGTVEIPLDAVSVLDAAGKLVGQGIESIAIAFLHAYANPAHEQEAARLVAERYPSVILSLSSDVAPQIREFDRTSTTVANAYVKPLAEKYLNRLSGDLAALGITAPLFMMLSNGGLTHVDEAKRVPVQLLESGPAAGALSAAFFGERSGCRDLLAFDLGGTTAKLALVHGGEPLVVHKFEAGRERRFTAGSGLPLTISTIELIEIGAGGGSIAAHDALGLLKVGPRSASSVPGPACYGRGGMEPTVTDGNLLLGYLDAETFAGGTMKLSMEAARSSVGALASAAGLDVPQTAAGIHAVVNETMAAAARVHVAEQGHDPRDFALLVTGGGGPLHGCELARRLGITQVICPPGAGVASALGLLLAPARVDRVTTISRRLDGMDWSALEDAYAKLEAEARAVIAATIGGGTQPILRRAADLRFVGQGYELITELPSGPYDASKEAMIRGAFLAGYERVFSRRPAVAAIEIINIRVSATGSTAGSSLDPEVPEAAKGDPRTGTRLARFGQVEHEVPVLDRRRLAAGTEIAGPAIVEEAMSTLLIPPGARAVVEAGGNIAIHLTQPATAVARECETA